MPLVSIIVPTLNEAHSIGKTLNAAEKFGEQAEIIVVDGGSEDATISIAENYQARVFKTSRGRGSQMRTGAVCAKGEILWFLHADTVPPPDAIEQIINALTETTVVGGNFTICFDGKKRAARFLTWLYPQLRKINLCYGDSAIFVRRAVYEKVGGFEPFPIFEDLDLVGKIRGEGQMINLSAKVITSSRRFEKRNFAFTFAHWMFLQGLYWLGVSPYFLNKLYAPIRK